MRPSHASPTSLFVTREASGWETIDDVRIAGDLTASQQAFIDQARTAARAYPTPFNQDVDVERIMERASHRPGRDDQFDALCQCSLTLVAARRDNVVDAARDVRKAADRFLSVHPNADAKDRGFALELRRKAAQTLQHRFDQDVLTLVQRLAAGSDERAQAMRTHAARFAEHFGVHRGPAGLGVDFILDADGRVAYGFKPMVDGAPHAACASRIHRSLETMLSNTLGMPGGIDLHVSTGELVSMPDRWSDAVVEASDPQEREETFGVLMPAPRGFDLDLGPTPDAPHGADARLAQALARPLGQDAFERVSLAALFTGECRPRLEDVLVDRQGKTWMLKPEQLMAPARVDAPAGEGVAPAASRRGLWERRPLRSDLLRALAEMKIEMFQAYLKKCATPSRREIRLLSQALGMHAPQAAGEARQALIDRWPSAAARQRALRQVEALRDWAQMAFRTQETLRDQPAHEIDDSAMRLDGQASLDWFLAHAAREDVAGEA